jgi:hypothetical protein
VGRGRGADSAAALLFDLPAQWTRDEAVRNRAQVDAGKIALVPPASSSRRSPQLPG